MMTQKLTRDIKKDNTIGGQVKNRWTINRWATNRQAINMEIVDNRKGL